jgi:ferredoxin
MKKVWIEPGCITCGLCEFLAPKIFEVTDISHVRTQAPIEKEEAAIESAVSQCPVSVIKYEE